MKGYLQLKLDSASSNKLKKKAIYPNVFCHHVTIIFGVSDDDERVKKLLKVGDVTVYAGDIYKDDSAQAVKIDVASDTVALSIEDSQLLREIGRKQNFHVTISTQKDVKPVYSNTLLRSPEAEVDPFNEVLKGSFEFFPFGSGK